MSDLPTFSVHMHCTACGGSGRLGDGPCHCTEESERNFRSFARMRADLLHAEATITSLCDRLDKINLIAHDRNTHPSARLKQIREWSAGFMPIPTDKS